MAYYNSTSVKKGCEYGTKRVFLCITTTDRPLSLRLPTRCARTFSVVVRYRVDQAIKRVHIGIRFSLTGFRTACTLLKNSRIQTDVLDARIKHVYGRPGFWVCRDFKIIPIHISQTRTPPLFSALNSFCYNTRSLCGNLRECSEHIHIPSATVAAAIL